MQARRRFGRPPLGQRGLITLAMVPWSTIGPMPRTSATAPN